MEWIQILTILGTNLGLFVWARTEANHDRRHIYDLMELHRKESLDIIKEIQKEMKDFHNRLFSLEDRSKKDILKS